MFRTLSLLVIFSFASRLLASPSSSHLRRLQRELASSTSFDACLIRRSTALSRAEARLETARRCTYAGLSPCAFSDLSALCKKTDEISSRLNRCGPKQCPRIQQRLRQAQLACQIIRVNDPNREKCADISMIRNRIQEIKKKSCTRDPKVRSTAVIHKEMEAVANNVRKDLGLPPPPFESEVIEPIGAVPDTVVFVLHGLGGTIERTKPIVHELIDLNLMPKTRWVIPQAKTQFNTFSNATIPSWFDILTNEIGGEEATESVIEAGLQVNEMIDIQTKIWGFRPNRVLIFGISQGGAVAITVYLRHKVGGVFSFSGYLPILNTYPEDLTQDSKDAVISMVHGTLDEIVPVQAARLSAAAIKSFNRTVEYVEYEGEGHSLDGVRQDLYLVALRMFRKSIGLSI